MFINKKIESILFVIIIILGFTYPAVAQETESPRAILVYFDSDLEINVYDKDGFEYEFPSFGMELRNGDRVETSESTAEIQLTLDGSIIKLSENTDFAVEDLYTGDSATSNRFAVQNGRMRAVVAKGTESRFSVSTRTAVGGVRGTDFLLTVVPDKEDTLHVLSGSVEFANKLTEQKIMVGAGQSANTFADIFTPRQITEAEAAQLREAMSFKELDPQTVPRKVAADSDNVEESEEDESDESGDQEIDENNDEPTSDQGNTQLPTPNLNTENEIIMPEIPASQQEGVLDGLITFLGGYMGMEIGSISIGGQTYGKAVLQPEFSFGKLGLGLYLPVIYTNDLFDPESWYQPGGNNEWSFGTDPEYTGENEEAWLRIQDFYSDLWLKIRYIRWGQPRDTFFLQAGNISSMTLGHGILMNQYANDKDFPQIRRVGLNLGIDPGKVGMELVINDLSKPEILGARVFLRPAFPVSKIGIGVSAAADIKPATEIDPDTTNSVFLDTITADPAIIHGAIDVDIPIIEKDLFSIILFGDAGTVLPYLRNDLGNLNAGLQLQTLMKDETVSISSFRNYGIMSGIFGDLFGVRYRLEYRNLHGIFRPLYNASYERFRADSAAEIITFLQDSDNIAYETRIQGIYGEAGFSIFDDKLALDVGYLWPWGQVADIDTDDYLLASLQIGPGLVPLGIYGGVRYSRYGFVQTIASDEEISLFDAKTIFEGEIVYPLAPSMQLALTMGTSAKRNSLGNLVYDDNGRVEAEFSMGIETRIGY